MKTNIKISFLTLLLMISFASVNAVLFTPGLPDITAYFNISSGVAQHTITSFLIGYALGQLVYGPFANRFGRKPTLYGGIVIQILSSFLCILAGYLHVFGLLVFARFFLALGAGVGLKMAFTLVNECYEATVARQKISYLMLAFAITPGLGVAIGGFLNQHYGWISTFYAGIAYGILLLILVIRLPETASTLDLAAFRLKHLFQAYSQQFTNKNLVIAGTIMGASTAFVYVFAALAPFIAMDLLHMSSAEYGIANLIPAIGLIVGSLLSAKFAKSKPAEYLIKIGIIIICLAVLLMFANMKIFDSAWLVIFMPMIVLYIGSSFIFANTSAIAMNNITDKAHASAVMSFLNMGFATAVVLSLGIANIYIFLLPTVYVFLALLIAILIFFIPKTSQI